MSDPRWERIQEVFNSVVDLDADARERRLREACGRDETLLADVRSLLDADQRGHSFLDEARLAVTDLAREDSLPRGTVIGAWRIVEVIGVGGMGLVHLAERADGAFHQEAALKVIKRGMDSAEILARFRAERQILARLQHPHVARLLDGGRTDDGRPWFAMEHIAGLPIDAYCREHDLDVAARLELFATVCDAVQYAHTNLVVHRDLKPDNIFVTAAGEVKLLDFGIAKVLGGEAGDGDGGRLTAVGVRILTPAYAAPEQRRGEPVNTAADIYSLGVILHEVLTGRRPRGTGLSGSVPETGTERTGPIPALRGDLAVICRMALQEDAGRRYPSAEALAMDVRHFLAGEPVLARPDSWGYRAGKFVKRNRVGVGAAAAAVLLIGTLVSFYTIRLRVERDRASAEAKKSAEVARFMVNVFARASPQWGHRLVTARQLLAAAVAGVDSLAPTQPTLYADLLVNTGMVYQELGDYAAAESQDRKLVRVDSTIFRKPDDLSIQGKSQLATTLELEGKAAEAEPIFADALAESRKVSPIDSVAIAFSLNNLAKDRVDLGHYRDAEAPFREAAAIYATQHIDMALAWQGVALRNLGRAERLAGDLAGADSAFAQALPALVAGYHTMNPVHPSLTEGYYQYAALKLDEGKLDSARMLADSCLTMRRKDYPAGHPSVGQSLVQLATIDRRAGRLTQAARELHEGDSILVKLLKPPHPYLAVATRERAELLEAEGRPAAALRVAHLAVARYDSVFPPGHPKRLRARITLARALVDRRECASAAATLDSVVSGLSAQLGAQHPWVLEAKDVEARRAAGGGCLSPLRG